MANSRRRFWIAVLASTAAALAVLCIAPLIGSTHIDYGRALAGLSPDREILFYTRLPRVLLALLALWRRRPRRLESPDVVYRSIVRAASRLGYRPLPTQTSKSSLG